MKFRRRTPHEFNRVFIKLVDKGYDNYSESVKNRASIFKLVQRRKKKK